MKKLMLFLACALGAQVAAVLLPQAAQAIESREILGREKAETFSAPGGTSGYTVTLEGDGTAVFAEACGPFVKDEGTSSTQAHYSAPEETKEPTLCTVSVTHRSSRDRSRLTLVLDQENESGLDLPLAGGGLTWTAGTHPSAPHSGLAGGLRLERPLAPHSNLAFTSELEYAGELIGGESGRWPQTGSSENEVRTWVGVAARPRLGLRWGLEGGFALNPLGTSMAAMPLGLRLALSQPIEPGNWLERSSRTQVLTNFSGALASQQLAADAAWVRWGTRLGALALTAGLAAEARYEGATIVANLEPRIGSQLATRWGTLRLTAGYVFGNRPGIRAGLSFLPY
ncbi:hypothetical protein HY732_04135 [Candidatus Uhrbacteria bacterium]|nr:hypothetical protein [Candidatus Uhrbacteria bacterium]